jgi:hypothetical protein
MLLPLKSIVTLPLLLATSVFAQPQAAIAPTDTQFHISGTVVSSPTGQVLADAEVSIGRAQTVDTVKSMVTEQNGHFEFDGLAPGKYWLAAQRRGFSRQSFEEHQGYFTAIAVGLHLQSENLVFRLRPDASISGRITDDQNDPVREAQVMLVRAAIENGTRTMHSREQSTTDDQGRYRFSPASTSSRSLPALGMPNPSSSMLVSTAVAPRFIQTMAHKALSRRIRPWMSHIH